VRELVDQGDLGPPGQHRVEVHLLELGAAVFDPVPRDHLQAVEQRRGMLPAVRFHERHHHVRAAFEPPVPLGEHVVRLAHPGRGAEIDPQLPGVPVGHRDPLGCRFLLLAHPRPVCALTLDISVP
jgi:hypothetical protein